MSACVCVCVGGEERVEHLRMDITLHVVRSEKSEKQEGQTSWHGRNCKKKEKKQGIPGKRG